METKKSLILAEKVFFEYLDIDKYPTHNVIISATDIVQMISTGIETALPEYENNKDKFFYDFFMWLRENDEKYLNKKIEKMIEIYLNENNN